MTGICPICKEHGVKLIKCKFVQKGKILTVYQCQKCDTRKDIADFIQANLRKYSVGMIEIVDDYKTCEKIGTKKGANYYKIIRDHLFKIICKYDASVTTRFDVRYFYLDSGNPKQKNPAWCVDCCLEIIQSQKSISEQLVSEGLPSVDFRVCAEYGDAVLTHPDDPEKGDLEGPAVVRCLHMEHCVPKNKFLIGANLYEKVKNSNNFSFKIKDCSDYFIRDSIYSVVRK